VCLIGQTAQIAPADRKLYALRDATATVESVPLIASSILSKKLAEGIDGLVLDVKVGQGAFMKTLPDARELAQTMVDLCRAVGRAAVELGAGRARKEDAVDPAAGLLLRKRPGDTVRAGETLAELHAASEELLDAGAARFRQAVAIADAAPPDRPLLLERIAEE